MEWFSDLYEGGLDLLFPPTCSACRVPLESGSPPAFCASCASDLSWIDTNLCSRCGHPQAADRPGVKGRIAPCGGFGGRRPRKDGLPHTCLWCAEHRPTWGCARSLLAYEGPLRKALLLFKYQKDRTIGRALATLFARNLSRSGLDLSIYDHLVPIPTHPKKLRQRGFHQILLLLEDFPRLLRRKISTSLLIRSKETTSQALLGRGERQKNLQESFACPLHTLPFLQGKSLLLIDDILTTGATSNACAATLLKAGAAKVDLLCLALSTHSS